MNRNPSPSPSRNGSDTSLFARAVRRFGSVWMGVALLIIIFTYSSIGSALPPVRQGALADWLGLESLRFEKTEMQWFTWWPFQVMIGLLCLAMVLATIRIRLRLINAGVWTIHTGIIMLAISSAVYFASKVEGDAVIFHSQALVLAPGMSTPASFVVRPEAQLAVGSSPNRYELRVAILDPDFVIRDGDARGRQTTAVWLGVSMPDKGYRYARRLLLGYPEATEDFLVDGTNIVPASERLAGRKLIDDQLQIQLWYDPAQYVYLHDTTAVYARLSPDHEWTQMRAAGVPHYYEHVDDPASVWVAPGENVPAPHPLDIEAQTGRDSDNPLRGTGGWSAGDDLQIRVTGFLPYANNHTGDGPDGRPAVRPYIVPRHQRQPASLARQNLSQIRVEVRQGNWSQKHWLRYHEYAFPDAQRAQPGRFIFDPTTVELPDGRRLELLYSRWREPLPAPVALDRFVLKTYPGGDQPSDYISRVRFEENGGWSGITEIRSNQPARHGDLWYFQSQYDPRTQSHTVLGVGNRVAVGSMLAGVCLSIAGMLFAFYVKPTLIRRRSRREIMDESRPEAESLPAPAVVSQPDVVLK